MSREFNLFEKIIVKTENPDLQKYNQLYGVIHRADVEFVPERKIIYEVFIKEIGYVFFNEEDLDFAPSNISNKLFQMPDFIYNELVLLKKNKKNEVFLIDGVVASDDGLSFYYTLTKYDHNFCDNESVCYEPCEIISTGKILDEKEVPNCYSGVTLRISQTGEFKGIVEGEDKLTQEQKDYLNGLKDEI